MIVCKSQAELEKMHRAGLVIWEVLNHLRGMAQPGVTTKELDEYAERRTAELKVRPAFKNYRGYPATLCTSINSEVVHGIPSKSRRLEEGDIISLDFGVEYDGYYADAAVTVPVGEITPELKRLLQVTRESLDHGDRKGAGRQPAVDISSRRAGLGGTQERVFGGARSVRPRNRHAHP